jgi:hypothetical protein
VGEVQLDEINADFRGTPRRVAPSGLHALDQVDIHDRRRRMHPVLVIGGRNRRPSALLRSDRAADHERRQHRGLAARMGELHAEFRASVLAEEGNDARQRLLVRVGIEAEAHRRNAPGRLDRGRFGDHQPQICERVGAEVDGVPLARIAVLRGVPAHRRQHDAIVERQSAQRNRRE